jgi:hypothetical protein
MSSTTDEYCNMSLARGAAENNAALIDERITTKIVHQPNLRVELNE